MSPIVFAAIVAVSDAGALETAIASARAGDEIVLDDGVYRVSAFACEANGPVVVRAKTRLRARIEIEGEGLAVRGSGWRFEDLEVQGVCSAGSGCTHAFAVESAAVGFVARGNRLIDFDSQIDGRAANGLVEANEVFDTHARSTVNDVAKIAVAAGDGWTVRANTVRDFRREDGTSARGIAFASGTTNAVIERNLVVCTRDENRVGGHTGITLDGHTGATVKNNIVANCSGPALSVTAAPSTRVLFNSFVSTQGVALSGAATSVLAHANLLEGAFASIDGAPLAVESDDVTRGSADLVAMYVDPALGDLRKKGDLSAVLAKSIDSEGVSDDFCGRARGAAPFDVGAIEHSLGDCIAVDVDAGDGGTKVPIAPGSGSSGSPSGQGDGSGVTSGPAAPRGHGGCRAVGPDARASMPCSAVVGIVLTAITITRRRSTRRHRS